MTPTVSQRKAVFVEIDGKGNYVEVTEWANGEGKDIHVSGVGHRDQSISLTYEEFDAIMVAWHYKEVK